MDPFAIYGQYYSDVNAAVIDILKTKEVHKLEVVIITLNIYTCLSTFLYYAGTTDTKM